MWYEDPLRMDNLDALSQFKAATHIPTTASETGLGLALLPEVFKRPGLQMRSTPA